MAGEAAAAASARRSRTSWGLGLGLALLGIAVVVLSERVPDPLQRGQPAPDFSVRLLDGRAPVTLESLRGRVVLLNFWASWCKPCEDEMPAMERLHQELAGQGFALLAISVDREAPEVAAFRDRLSLSFPIALDSDEKVSRLYQTTGYPESLLIDAEGRLVERYVGPRQWDDPAYVERIRALLAAPASG